MKVINMHGIKWDEVGDEIDTISYHDSEVEIYGEDSLGFIYKAVAMLSCDEIVDVYEDTIEREEL